MELPTSDPLRKEIFDGHSTERMLHHAARICDERHFSDFPIIDCDAHHYEAESIAEIAEFIDDETLRQEAKSNPRFPELSGGRLKRDRRATQLAFHFVVCPDEIFKSAVNPLRRQK